MKKQNSVAFFNILSTVLLYGISIFTAPLFSRLLGTSGYGIVSIYSIWVSVVGIVFTLQTHGTLVNARVEYPEEDQPKYQSSVMTLSLLAFLCGGGMVVLFSDEISRLLSLEKPLIYLILIHGFGTFCVNFLNNKYTYEFKAGRNCAISVGITLTTLVLSVVLIWLLPDAYNYYGRILGMAGTYAVLGAVICIWILLKGRTFYHRGYWKLCLTLALPVVFYNLSDLILGQCDRLMLQGMLDTSSVGQYSLAYNFGGIMFTIFGALNNTWCPFFFEDMKQGRRDALKKQAGNFLEVFTVLSAGFVLLATEVYHIFARQDFWAGTILIPIFVSGYYLNFLCTFPVNYEYYRKKTKMVAIITISSSLTNIVLNYFLIQRMGIAGAALATAISHGLQLTLHYLYTRYFLGKSDYPFGFRMWMPYAAAFLGIAVFSALTPDWWLVRWVAGAAIGVWELLRIKKRKVLI